MTLAKPKSHWRNPRKAIASNLRHHDIAYATHGALQAMQVLRQLAVTSGSSVLDYGCGTGRIARVLTPVFARVYGFDPVPETIAVGNTEAMPLTFSNLVLTTNLDQVPEVDDAFSVNVIEHLSDSDAEEMIDNLKVKVRHNTVLWYHPQHNRTVLDRYLSDNDKRDDDWKHANGSTVVVRTLRFRQ